MSTDKAIAYSIRGAVAASGLSRSRLYELIANGAVEARKDGRKTLVLGESLRACIYALPQLGAGKRAVANRSTEGERSDAKSATSV
jgi:hypothetical protein